LRVWGTGTRIRVIDACTFLNLQVLHALDTCSKDLEAAQMQVKDRRQKERRVSAYVLEMSCVCVCARAHVRVRVCVCACVRMPFFKWDAFFSRPLA